MVAALVKKGISVQYVLHGMRRLALEKWHGFPHGEHASVYYNRDPCFTQISGWHTGFAGCLCYDSTFIMTIDGLMMHGSLATPVALVIAFTAIFLWIRSHTHGGTSTEHNPVPVDEKTTYGGSSLSADPDPLYDFNLKTATSRNFVYVNKTVRYPYFQVSLRSGKLE